MFRRSAGTQPWRRAVRSHGGRQHEQAHFPPRAAGLRRRRIAIRRDGAAVRLRGRSDVHDAADHRPGRTGARPAIPRSRRRRRPTACGGRRSTIRRSIAWSSSPTARTCRCRSRGCRIVEARAQLGVATGRQFPQTQVASRQRDARSGSAEQLANCRQRSTATSSTTRSGFDAAWELDFWGKYRRGVEAETASLLASVADYYSALVSLTAEVARTYVVIRTFEVLIEQARAERQASGGGAATSPTSRFRNGATSELDVDPGHDAAGEHPGVHPPAAESGSQQARNALSTLLGQPAGAVDALLAGPKEIPRAPAQGGGRRAGRDAAAASGHPQRRAAGRRAVRAHRRRQGRSLSELLAVRHDRASAPSAAARSPRNLVLRRQPLLLRRPRASTGPSSTTAASTNSVRVEDARFQQLLVNYRDTVLKAAQEVEDALTGFLNAQEATVFEQRAVTAAAARRWSSPSCSTAKAPWTTSACSTRSVRSCSSRTAWRRRARPSPPT